MEFLTPEETKEIVRMLSCKAQHPHEQVALAAIGKLLRNYRTDLIREVLLQRL